MEYEIWRLVQAQLEGFHPLFVLSMIRVENFFALFFGFAQFDLVAFCNMDLYL